MGTGIQKQTIFSSLFALALAASSASAGALQERFPTEPDAKLTPGTLCVRPDNYRYKEKIPYCNRDVESSRKWQIIRTYDQQLGYQIERMNRGDFKIDHFIPLCMGGSNETNNLWPQHKSVYVHTDPLEGKLCELMAQGKLLQKDAIETIRRVKLHELDPAKALSDALRRL